jgi:hypothetical protein
MSTRAVVLVCFGLLTLVLAFGGAAALLGGQHWDNGKVYISETLPVVGLFCGVALWQARK